VSQLSQFRVCQVIIEQKVIHFKSGWSSESCSPVESIEIRVCQVTQLNHSRKVSSGVSSEFTEPDQSSKFRVFQVNRKPFA